MEENILLQDLKMIYYALSVTFSAVIARQIFKRLAKILKNH